MSENLPRLRDKANALPLAPGVYMMKDGSGKIIYIGKAKKLKNRVSQYFGSHTNHDAKTVQMTENVHDFDYILTDSEFEALTLECSLIKQHQPKYNILLKDDRGFHYIKVTAGEWPRVSAERQADKTDGANYTGPFTSSFAVSNAVEEALQVFRLPTCSKSFPRDIKKNSRPCLNFFIGRCCAPCAGKISAADYNEAVSEALAFIRGGNTAEAVEALKEQMERYAENLQFERAARCRDRIEAIRRINAKQKVVASGVPHQDVFALAATASNSCVEVFRFKDGRLYDREHFIFDAAGDREALRSEFLLQYYSSREIPPHITLDGPARDEVLLRQWLRKKAGRAVRVTRPQKGDQARLAAMCHTNACERLAQLSGGAAKDTAALEELAELLGLDAPPEYIEAYDISHTAGADNVAGMVVFKDGRPFKAGYKKFAVKSFAGQDDYASMREILDRRFSHYDAEKESGEGFGRLPDLILLDGGRGQLSAVRPVLEKYGLKIPLFGMVKDSKHRTRAIAGDGGETAISSKRRAFALVSGIQEEVHRFAVGYHRQKHKKSALGSSLLGIPGVGEARMKALLKHFKTISAMREASEDELAQVKGMTRPAAKAVYEYFIKTP